MQWLPCHAYGTRIYNKIVLVLLTFYGLQLEAAEIIVIDDIIRYQ